MKPEKAAALTGANALPRSLRVRLLWGSVAGIALALLVSGVMLTKLFKEHVVGQFQAALERQLDQLVTELDFDAGGRLRVDANAMLDPRLLKPYSGLYWQIDALPEHGEAQIAVLRSRSLWDSELAPEPERLAKASDAGHLRVAGATGPAGESLLLLQRVVSWAEAPGMHYRLMLAGDLRFNLDATHRFGMALAWVLGLLFVVLALAGLAQVGVGLRPLQELQRGLRRLREGSAERLEGLFPQEVQPLVDDFNDVLQTNAGVVERARTQAGNLAHALKTPLAVLENEAARAQSGADPMDIELVREQLGQVRRHVDWHMQRSRAAAARRLPGRHTGVEPCVAGLLRVFERVFAERQIQVTLTSAEAGLRFAGEQQDLQEILGNLLENAWKWAASEIRIGLARSRPGWLALQIEDDGPGIAEAQLDAVRERGVRLDEHTPGSGLGLAIVQDLVQLHEGELHLANRPQGGLCATVILPEARPAGN